MPLGIHQQPMKAKVESHPEKRQGEKQKKPASMKKG